MVGSTVWWGVRRRVLRPGKGRSEVKKHWRYLKYVLRHKWYVFLACLEYGLLWRGIKHDWHKFLPDEWGPYSGYDFSKGLPKTTGYIHELDPDEVEFNIAMNKHHNRGDHHWEHWLLRNKDGSTLALPMPEICAKEMIADWRGAGLAQGRPKTWEWYLLNRDNIQLHRKTRMLIEYELHQQALREGGREVGVDFFYAIHGNPQD